MRRAITRLLPVLAVTAFSAAEQAGGATAPPPTSGIVRDYMDTSVAPCRDFFRYANGAWFDKAEIPPEHSVIGAGREVADRNQLALHDILEAAARDPDAEAEKDATRRKLGHLYKGLMDSARADAEGVAAVAAELKEIDAIQTREQLAKALASFALRGVPTPFQLGPEPDRDNSSMNIAQLAQGGLGLPERDYYFRTDPKSDSLRKAYVATVAELLVLAGAPKERAAAAAENVMRLETALAESAMTRVAMRDPYAVWHKMKVRELEALAPALPWRTLFGQVGVQSLERPDAVIDVSMPAFTKRLSERVAGTPIEDWRDYLKTRLLFVSGPWMGQRLFDAVFAFNSRLSGQRVPQPRWKRAAGAVDQAMGEGLGRLYVEREFPASSKQRMLELVANLRAAFQERIESRPWMTAETRKQALGKLAAVEEKIGYPEKWRDYTALEIDPKAPASQNLRRAAGFEARRQLAQIGKPVDRTEWRMSPPTVNAYYNGSRNEIVFPAGILMPPYFDPKADDAVNYGAIGMVIGHELSHGFDDRGRQFDAEGNLKDWWTADDAKQFKERADKMVAQYGGYVAVDTLKVNGKLTLGENIADLGGLTIAYHAWQRSLRGKPKPPVIDGFTPEQRFFLGFAQMWRRKVRPEQLRTAALTDTHSPAYWRVNGTVSNSPEFAQAFGCSSGEGVVNAEAARIEIW